MGLRITKVFNGRKIVSEDGVITQNKNNDNDKKLPPKIRFISTINLSHKGLSYHEKSSVFDAHFRILKDTYTSPMGLSNKQQRKTTYTCMQVPNSEPISPQPLSVQTDPGCANYRDRRGSYFKNFTKPKKTAT